MSVQIYSAYTGNIHPTFSAPPGWTWSSSPAPVTALTDATDAVAETDWSAVAEAIGEMEATVNRYGWIRGSLLNAYGVCMLGAFLNRKGITVGISEQGTPLGLAVGQLLVSVIRGRVPYVPQMDETWWSAVIFYNDRLAKSKEEIIGVLQAARAKALANAEATTETEPEETEVIEVPDFIPGEFTGLLQAIGA